MFQVAGMSGTSLPDAVALLFTRRKHLPNNSQALT